MEGEVGLESPGCPTPADHKSHVHPCWRDVLSLLQRCSHLNWEWPVPRLCSPYLGASHRHDSQQTHQPLCASISPSVE